MQIRENRSWSESGPCNETEVRVLLVDDYREFREFESVILRTVPDLCVIGEAETGLGAVEAARQLQPHLILLDIGLPDINGLEAARGIRQVSPRSKILFVTNEHSQAILEAALSLGASGYVVKHNAATDLPAASQAALEGKRFISSFLTQ